MVNIPLRLSTPISSPIIARVEQNLPFSADHVWQVLCDVERCPVSASMARHIDIDTTAAATTAATASLSHPPETPHPPETTQVPLSWKENIGHSVVTINTLAYEHGILWRRGMKDKGDMLTAVSQVILVPYIDNGQQHTRLLCQTDARVTAKKTWARIFMRLSVKNLNGLQRGLVAYIKQLEQLLIEDKVSKDSPQ